MKTHDCPICMKKVINIDKVITKCDHVFHFTCLFKNLKFNYNTGDRCPLCRKSFIISTSSTTINPLVAQQPSLFQPLNQIPIRPPPPPTVNTFTQINRIIQHRQQNLQRVIDRRRRQQISIPEETSTEEDRITTYISELTFKELKNKLKEKGVSSRGYLRESLEKRLYRAMRNQ